jgi:aminopeptidase N
MPHSCRHVSYKRLAMPNASSLHRFIPILMTLGLVACGKTPVPVEAGVSEALAQHRASVISELHYELRLSIPENAEEDIPGRITLAFELSDASQPLQVDFREQADRFLGARVNGSPADIPFVDEHLVVPARLLKPGANALEFDFEAGSLSLNRNPDFLYTLFVPDRARTAFPVFDQPDLKASWSLNLEIPADWNALSAAPLANAESNGQRQTLQFARSDRISSYLFSFVAGNFERVIQNVGGRPMTLLHRENDTEKVARNVDEIFRLHAAALEWLEHYTGIDYPYQKLDIALLPAHPYGGMEHVGAIQYRAERLWLEEDASDADLLNRASLIAHEVAHMWFGNLVTMRWFDDVWTKEVFANFMAAKIVNPSFPAIDHDLNFVVDHHPGAYSVDRTAGANPIRQPLANLNQAGQLYGPIIYDKAPIMMRQLELLLGEEAFRKGISEYLHAFAHGNSSWPELISILDRYSEDDVSSWSETWVNTPGRPAFSLLTNGAQTTLNQTDPDGEGRFWPQRFAALAPSGDLVNLEIGVAASSLPPALQNNPAQLLLNADGFGYGLFPVNSALLSRWEQLPDLPLASLLISSYEQMLDTGGPTPTDYLDRLLAIALTTENQLLLELSLGQLQGIYWRLIDTTQRTTLAATAEGKIWEAMLGSKEDSVRKIYFNAYSNLAVSEDAVNRLAAIWEGDIVIDGLPLAERDLLRLTQILAIKDPDNADRYVQQQLARTRNADQRRRLAFLAPSLSAEQNVRDAFFASLAEKKNRETESWVLDALSNLHHPLRTASSERYILTSLELLEEIQVTGDIFFPAGWINRTLRNHHTASAAAVVQDFLAARPDYNPQLAMKILQAADPLYRSQQLH